MDKEHAQKILDGEHKKSSEPWLRQQAGHDDSEDTESMAESFIKLFDEHTESTDTSSPLK